MTRQERAEPDIIVQQITRQRRIAKGSGRSMDEVKDLLDRFTQMRTMLQSFGGMAGGGGGLLSKIPGMKNLSAMNQMRNMDMSALMGGGGMEGMGGANPFESMMQSQQPQLPKGYNQPGVRMESAKSKKAAQARRKKKASQRAARKRGRKR